MDFLLDALTDWLKEMLVGGIMSNLSGMFDSVNQQVADIATQVGQTPQGWNGSIFSMIQNLSNSIMVPIAGVILAIVMTLELIQMITDKNNLHDVDTWMIFKWVFKSAAAILIVTNTWKGIGYGCLIYISSINGIEASYFEAAELDGANKFQQIWNITLPEILPSVITLTLLSIGRIFYSDFGLFYQVPRDSGLLYSTTNTIDTYVYRGLMKLGNVGMASAAGFYQSVVGFILVLLSNWVVRKISPDNALF